MALFVLLLVFIFLVVMPFRRFGMLRCLLHMLLRSQIMLLGLISFLLILACFHLLVLFFQRLWLFLDAVVRFNFNLFVLAFSLFF